MPKPKRKKRVYDYSNRDFKKERERKKERGIVQFKVELPQIYIDHLNRILAHQKISRCEWVRRNIDSDYRFIFL